MSLLQKKVIFLNLKKKTGYNSQIICPKNYIFYFDIKTESWYALVHPVNISIKISHDAYFSINYSKLLTHKQYSHSLPQCQFTRNISGEKCLPDVRMGMRYIQCKSTSEIASLLFKKLLLLWRWWDCEVGVGKVKKKKSPVCHILYHSVRACLQAFCFMWWNVYR